MQLKKFLLATVAGSMISTAAMALTQDMIDALAADLGAEGYTRIEITDFGDRFKVEATGPTGKLERVYDANGAMLKEERKTRDGQNGDDEYDDDYDDDHDDDHDDDYDDDHDDDRDDDHDDDDDDDEDDDRDDDDDDDRDDDDDDDRDDDDD